VTQSVWAELEALGEDRVLAKLTAGDYESVPSKRRLVVEWLASKQAARTSSREARIERRASRANLIAWIAIAIAAASMIKEIVLYMSGK
jgi:NADPH-dependent ferric siderophore reductase